jgi:hypothetical protein
MSGAALFPCIILVPHPYHAIIAETDGDDADAEWKISD